MSSLHSSTSDPEPVFVDTRRWRRPALRWLGIIVAVMLAVYLWVVGLAVLSTVTVPPAKPSQTVSDSSSGQEEPLDPWPRRATRP